MLWWKAETDELCHQYVEQCCGSNGSRRTDRWLRMKSENSINIDSGHGLSFWLAVIMKTADFKEAEKDLEQGSYEYALDEFTTSVNMV